MPPTEDLSAAALEARQAELRAQMVAAYGDGVRVELPPAPGDPHVFTSLAAWTRRVAEIGRKLPAKPLLERKPSARPRQPRRARTRVTRGSPSSSQSADDPDPPGLLRVAAGTWRYARAAATTISASLKAVKP